MSNFEVTEGPSPVGVHHPLRYPFVGEMGQFIDQIDVLQQGGALVTDGQAGVLVADRIARSCRRRMVVVLKFAGLNITTIRRARLTKCFLAYSRSWFEAVSRFLNSNFDMVTHRWFGLSLGFSMGRIYSGVFNRQPDV